MIGAPIEKDEIDKLRQLYFGNARHSSYLPVPSYLASYFPEVTIDAKWRHPGPRIDLLVREFRTLRAGQVVEVGSNTGVQLLELARQFPALHFVAGEICHPHLEFTRWCLNYERLQNVKLVSQDPRGLSSKTDQSNSVVLDFNVAHHAGIDFAVNQSINPHSWWTDFLPTWLSHLPFFHSYWFSFGYRLGGDRQFPLANPDLPSGVIERVLTTVSEYFPSVQTSVYMVAFDPNTGLLRYEFQNLNDLTKIDEQQRMLRAQDLYRGEYFSRPLFHFVSSELT